MSIADVLDVAHSLIADSPSDQSLDHLDTMFSEAGKKWRETIDPNYQKKTWGMKPGAAEAVMAMVKPRKKKA